VARRRRRRDPCWRDAGRHLHDEQAEQVRYITDHCDAKVSFADTAAQVAKFVAEKERLPKLEVVVQMTGTPARTPEGEAACPRVERVPEARRRRSRGELEERLSAEADDVCTLIYTSGTTVSRRP